VTVPPAMFGYAALDADLVEANPRAADHQAEAWREEFAQFAARNGYTLAGVFVDARGRAEAFYALIERIHTDDVTLVVVPDPTHLEHLACLTGADLRAASHYLRARILLLPAATGR
jgi:hypothetical protein